MDTIKILILEHDPNDLELLQYALRKSELTYMSHVVTNKKDYEKSLVTFRPDVILSDYSLPSFDGLTAFCIKQKVLPKVPFIVVSGTIGEENAVELIKMGITDYVLKEKMYQVIPKIVRALKEAEDRENKVIAEQKLKEREQQLQNIMDSSADVICTIDSEGRFVKVGAASVTVWGYEPEELIGKKSIELVFSDDVPASRQKLNTLIQGAPVIHFENRLLRKDCSIVPIFWTARWDENEKLAYCVARDATAIKEAEQELAEQNDRIRNILESITEGFISLDKNWTVRYWNKEAEYLLGRRREEVMGKYIWDEYKEAMPLKFYSEYHRVMDEGVSSTFEEYFPPIGKWIQVSAYPARDGISIFFKDITENKRQEDVRRLKNEVFEFYTKPGSTIEKTIELLLNGVQKIHSDLLCSTLKVRKGRLYYWAFSQLPKPFIQETDGMPIAVGEGTCGTAAFLNEKVVVKDIITGALVKKFVNAAVKHEIRAGISYPLADPYRNVLGTFSVYLKTIRDLTDAEERTLESVKYVLQHIMENHIAEAALRENEEKYSRLFNQNPMPMWVFDPETYRFLSVNEAALRHYGYSREEFLSMSIKDIRPKDALKQLETNVKKGKRDGGFNTGVFDHLKKSGELIKVAVTSNLISLGDVTARLVLVNDITERLKAEQAMERSEKRFKALVQEGSDLINVIDVNGVYKYASPASAIMMGIDPANIVGKSPFEYVHEDDRERIVADLKSLLTTKRVKTAPFRFRNASGEYRWLESIGTNLLDDPAVEGIVVNSKDITERIQYIKAVEKQNSQLREIAWIQSHIVRAPLARIMGLVDLIKNYSDREGQATLLEHMLTSAHELDDVIRTIVRKTEQVEDLQDETHSITG